MTGPTTIALSANPPHRVCPPLHQINAQISYDFEIRSSSSSSTAATSTSAPQRHVIGGLSRIFSSPTTKPCSASLPLGFSGGIEEKGLPSAIRGEEFSIKERALSKSPRKLLGTSRREHSSPVSVLQGPVSCCRSDAYANGSVCHGFARKVPGNPSANSNSYDFPSPVAIFGGMADPNELTFSMDYNHRDLGNGDRGNHSVEEMLVAAQARHRIFHEGNVVKAFYEAEWAHRGQVRASGYPYIQHCVETAVLLAKAGATSTIVAAGLLHNTIDDSCTSYDHISRTFGAAVADLVEGVSKLNQLSQLDHENNTASETVKANRLHTMFLAMADARAVLIKLADRLHDMIMLEALPVHKQQKFAKETLEIFVPLANRLGISTWKDQLENLCFKHLNPDLHRELSSQLSLSYDERIVASAQEKLKVALEEQSFSYHSVSGRQKSLYSIHCKMIKKNLSMDKIHDVHGVRLIVENEEDCCYRALRLVHQLWPEVPRKFKDYIVRPKLNGYRSLHMVVMSDEMVPIEVQIRTREMHLQAEFGLAAHWRYKEGDCEHSASVLRMLEWARWVISWQCENMNKDGWSVRDLDPLEPPCRFPSHLDNCSYSCEPHHYDNVPLFNDVLKNGLHEIMHISCRSGSVQMKLIKSCRPHYLQMPVLESPAGSTVTDLLARVGEGIPWWAMSGIPLEKKREHQD